MSSAKYQRPNSAEARSEAAQDIVACRALLQENSRTFFAASLLLPKAVREPSLALYAFCRVADDAVDLQADKHGAVADLTDRLARLYDGQPGAASADRAFADVATRFAIPREIPQALIEGFAWDAEFRRYETLNDLYGYAARVAGTVGVMMALLMGARSASALARACDLGVAMQLSNIARDVGEDAGEKRLFLPLEWLRAEGIDPEVWLETPLFTPALGRVVQRLPVDHHIARGKLVGHALQMNLAEHHLRAGRTDIYAHAVQDDIVLYPQRVLCAAGATTGCIAVMVVVVVVVSVASVCMLGSLLAPLVVYQAVRRVRHGHQ